LIALHVVILKEVTTIYAASINLSALLVLLVAIYKDDLVASWFGFFAGLLLSAGLPWLLGWYALITAALALGACYVRERLNLESLRAKYLLLLGGLLVHNVAGLIILRVDGFWTLLWASALLGAIYTSIIGWLFFLVKEGRLTFARLRALF
jgi:hypothetical protein